MKIGIITFWESKENYGQLAQACALQIYLEERGHTPFLIRYDKSYEVNKLKPCKLEKLRQLNWKKLFDPNAVSKKLMNIITTVAPPADRKFKEFREDFIRADHHEYNSYEELKANPPEADLYITGSDQVWNHHYTGNPKPFFLQFGSSDAKRAAYAASFGHKELPVSILNQYEQYLRSFAAIGVREKSGVDLCKEMGYKNAILLPDPTILIDKEQWMKYSQPSTAFAENGKRKVLIYTLGNRSSEINDKAIAYVKSREDSDVVHVSINKDPDGETFPSIPQWFDLFDKTDHVLTNSFHGMLFSIIFRKRFISIPSSGEKAGMNERLFTVLEKFDLFDHLLTAFSPEKFDQMMDIEVDWKNVSAQIDDWRRVAKKFLDRLTSPTPQENVSELT